MKSYFLTMLLGLAFLSVSCDRNEVPDIVLEIPKEINLQSADFEEINQLIKTHTTFAEMEIYNRWGQKVYQSQDKNALITRSTFERPTDQGPLYYILKYNISQNQNLLESQNGNLIW